MVIEVKKPITTAKIIKASQRIGSENKKGFDAYKYAGRLKNVYGDALDFQKKMRDEWN